MNAFFSQSGSSPPFEPWKMPDPVHRAWVNGTLDRLANDIQRLHWRAGFPCDDETALRIAAAKVVARAKLPPNLQPDHVARCPRCGKAHLLPLTEAEQCGYRDPVDRLCAFAQAVVNQDYVALKELAKGNTLDQSRLTQIADVRAGRAATTGGGRRLPHGLPSYDGDEEGAGHQGTGGGGVGPAPRPRPRRRRRIATGSRADNKTLQEIADALRDQVARQTAETAMTARKLDWTLQRGPFGYRERASARQQEAAYLVHVLGWSQREAAKRMKVSGQRVQALLKDFVKNAGYIQVGGLSS